MATNISGNSSSYFPSFPLKSFVTAPFYWIANTDTVQNALGRFQVKCTSVAMDMLKNQALKTPKPQLTTLLDNLKEIQQKVKSTTPSIIPDHATSQLTSMAVQIESLIQSPASFLDGARDEQGNLIKISTPLEDLKGLLKAFQMGSIPDPDLLSRVITWLSKVEAAQQGWVSKQLGAKTLELFLPPNSPQGGLSPLNCSTHGLPQKLLQHLIILQQIFQGNTTQEQQNPLDLLDKINPLLADLLKALNIQDQNHPLKTVQDYLQSGSYFPETLQKALPSAISFLNSLSEEPNAPIFGQPMIASLLSQLNGQKEEKQVPSSNALPTKIAESRTKIQERLIPKQEPIKIPVHKSLEDALAEQLKEIGDIITKMALIQLLPLEGDRKALFYQSYAKAKQDSDKDANTSLDAVFLNTVRNTFEMSSHSKSLFYQIRYEFHLKVTLPFLQFYVDEIISALKKDLLIFLKRSGNDRVQDIFTAVFEPLEAHITTYTCFNLNLVQTGVQLNGTVDQANASFFHKSLSVDTILTNFIHLIVERYAPQISWTRALENRLSLFKENKLPQWEPLNQVFTLLKGILVWTSFISTALLEKLVDYGVKYVIKKKCVEQLKLNLFKTEAKNDTTHSRYQYIINKFLYEKLVQFTTPHPTNEEMPSKIRSSLSTQQQLQKITGSLFKVIPLSAATHNFQELQMYNQDNTLQQVKKGTYNSFVEHFNPSIALEILKWLEHFLYDDKPNGQTIGLLSEFFWVSLNNLSRTLTTGAGEVNETAMITVEKDMQSTLENVVNLVVTEGVKTALDPSLKHQKEVDATITSLKQQVLQFQATTQQLTLKNFSKCHEAWKNLNKAIHDMQTYFQGLKVKKIGEYGNQLLANFETATQELNTGIQLIIHMSKEKKKYEEHLKKLNTFYERIQSQELLAKFQTLQMLAEHEWIPGDIQNKTLSYIEFLRLYLKISNRSFTTLQWENHFKLDLLEALDHQRKTLSSTLQIAQNEINQALEKIQGQQSLAQWTKQIQSLAITPQDVSNPWASFIKVMNLPIDNSLVVPMVTGCILELLKFKDKSYHWNGVLSRMIQATTDHLTHAQ